MSNPFFWAGSDDGLRGLEGIEIAFFAQLEQCLHFKDVLSCLIAVLYLTKVSSFSLFSFWLALGVAYCSSSGKIVYLGLRD